MVPYRLDDQLQLGTFCFEEDRTPVGTFPGVLAQQGPVHMLDYLGCCGNQGFRLLPLLLLLASAPHAPEAPRPKGQSLQLQPHLANGQVPRASASQGLRSCRPGGSSRSGCPGQELGQTRGWVGTGSAQAGPGGSVSLQIRPPATLRGETYDCE